MASPADANAPPRKHPPSRRAGVTWAVRARTTVHDAKRYARFVGVMKRVLLVAAGALLLAVIIYALQPRDTNKYAMNFEHLGHLANDLTMARPRLMGRDSDGSPFVVTADKAVQEPRDVHRARLYNVEADLKSKDGAWYDLRSPNGYLDSGTQKLWLFGNLSMFSDSGYELHTAAAFVDLAPGCDPSTGKPVVQRKPKRGKPPPRCASTTIRGSTEVTGQGPFGTLRADRFHIVKGTRHVYLDGHVRMVLYPAHGAKAGKRSSK